MQKRLPKINRYLPSKGNGHMAKVILFATVALLLSLAPGANAALIASFSQNPSATPTVFATDNGTTTNIAVNSASTSITTGASGVIPNAFFSLAASSVGIATQIGSQIIERFNGNFCFTSAIGCGGTNYLSGIFTDAAFGANGGPGLTVNVNNPPDTLTLTSGVLPANILQPPSTFNISFADLVPLLHINGTTIGGFTADFAGNISSSVAAKEPAALALLGLGVIGLGFIRYKHKPTQYNYA